jgi:hypothetical protein
MPPQSSALGFALEYGNAHLVPLLRRIWPLPDDLPHAAQGTSVASSAGSTPPDSRHWATSIGTTRLTIRTGDLLV